MGNSIKKFSELNSEKQKLQLVADDRLQQVKDSFKSVKEEGKLVMVNKILIPVGIAVVAGYGLKKLIDYVQSDDNPAPKSVAPLADNGPTTRASVNDSHDSQGHGLLSRINWSGLAVQLVPFIINVGKKMYEDGNLPYFNKAEEEEELE